MLSEKVHAAFMADSLLYSCNMCSYSMDMCYALYLISYAISYVHSV